MMLQAAWWRVFGVIFLAANSVFADATRPPSPVPSSAPAEADISESMLSCYRILKEFQEVQYSANSALRRCQLLRFHEECLRAREVYFRIKSGNARCSKLLEKNKIKFPEFACEVVRVPNQCD